MNRPSRLARVLLAGALVPLGGCVLPDQLASIQKEVADVQQRMLALERAQKEQTEALAKMDQQVRAQQQTRSDADLADLRADLDEAIRQAGAVSEGLGTVNTRIDRLSAQVVEVRELTRRTAAPVPPAAAPPVPPEAGIPGGAPPPTSPPGTGPAGVPDADALYNAAYADFSRGNYALAVSGFEEYLERFPQSDLADNALYWIAECRFSEGDFARAIEGYDGLLERFPRSDRAAAADLKKGLAYLEMNQIGSAVVQLNHVVQTYPGSDEARIARDRLASLKR